MSRRQNTNEELAREANQQEALRMVEEERDRLRDALQQLQYGPDTLTQGGLKIVNAALYGTGKQSPAETPEELVKRAIRRHYDQEAEGRLAEQVKRATSEVRSWSSYPSAAEPQGDVVAEKLARNQWHRAHRAGLVSVPWDEATAWDRDKAIEGATFDLAAITPLFPAGSKGDNTSCPHCLAGMFSRSASAGRCPVCDGDLLGSSYVRERLIDDDFRELQAEVHTMETRAAEWATRNSDADEFATVLGHVCEFLDDLPAAVAPVPSEPEEGE